MIMDFLSQFWPQLAATLIGLCLGIPITLFATFLAVGLGIPAGIWLNHLIERCEEKRRKKKILNSLNSELDYNLSQLIIWDKGESGDFEAGSLGVKLRNETWRAFSEGGELEWIKSTKILWFLSNAYNLIRMVQELSERHYNLTNFGQTGESGRGVPKYNQLLKDSVRRGKHSIKTTIAIIKKDLGES